MSPTEEEANTKSETTTRFRFQFQFQQQVPNDIITKILTYLPPKPLTQCKLLSKSMLSEINDPDFILLHIQRPTTTLSVSSISHDSPIPTLHTFHFSTPHHHHHPPIITTLPLPIPTDTLSSPVDLISSSHGLLFLAANPGFLSLLNPTNSTFHPIPPANLGGPQPDHGPPRWLHFGFGFDELAREYKVIRLDQVYHHDSLPKTEVRLFSLTTGEWRTVDEGFPGFLSHPMSHGKYLRNAVHWVGATSCPVVFDMTGLLWRGRLDDFVYDYVLVAFDLSLDKFRVLPLPEYGAGGLVVPRLSVGVFGECLFLQVEHGGKFERCVDVWVMKEYGVKESWVKLLSFPYMEVKGELLPIRTLALSKGGDEVLMQLGKECFWVDVGTGSVRDVVIDGGLPFLYELIHGHGCCFGAVVFVESLVRLSCRIGGEGIKEDGGGGGRKEGALEAGTAEREIKVKKKRGDILSSRFKFI